MNKRGKFISVEGIEGVGKSTNIDFVRSRLQAAGHEVIVTREPGGTPLAEEIRELVLTPDREVPALTELLLVFAARSAHVELKIRPAIESGTWVVCDRFTDATLAYQGGGRGMNVEHIQRLAGEVHGDLWPDLTLLLDAPVEVGLARAARRSEPDRFEREKGAFFERVRAAYLDLAASQPGRLAVVNADQPLPAVQAAIAERLENILETT